MARFDTYVTVPEQTLVLLGAAAAEHHVSIGRFASTVCDAAARLYAKDPKTSAMPSCAGALVGARSEVPVTLTGRVLALIAEAATAHGIEIDIQIRGVLIAAVRGYEPAAPGPGAAQRRKRFDPAYYARKAIIPDDPSPKASTKLAITAAVFGDPRRTP